MAPNPGSHSKQCTRCKKVDQTEFSTCRFCGTAYNWVKPKVSGQGLDIGALFRSPVFLIIFCGLAIFVGSPMRDKLTTHWQRQVLDQTKQTWHESNRKISNSPTDVDSLIKRADANLTLFKLQDAINDYTLAIKLRPSADLYRKRALVYDTWSKQQEAAKDRASAAKLEHH